MVCLTRGVGRRARVCATAGGTRHVSTLAGRRALELDHSESQEEIQNLAILPGMWAHKVWSQQALKKVPRIRQHSLSPQDTLSQAQSMEQCKAAGADGAVEQARERAAGAEAEAAAVGKEDEDGAGKKS